MKSFEKDHLVRDAQGKPLGRAVLAEGTVLGDRIAVSLLTVPKGLVVAPRGIDYYIDGIAYRIQSDLPSIRITEYSNKWIINSFFLVKVENDSGNGTG